MCRVIHEFVLIYRVNPNMLYSDLIKDIFVCFSSHQGFMSYMMDHANNLPKNTHFVGQLHAVHNNPTDIESEDAHEEDGDGVRTESRLIWKQEEDGRVVL
jgi:hypothetical protein